MSEDGKVTILEFSLEFEVLGRTRSTKLTGLTFPNIEEAKEFALTAPPFVTTWRVVDQRGHVWATGVRA